MKGTEDWQKRTLRQDSGVELGVAAFMMGAGVSAEMGSAIQQAADALCQKLLEEPSQQPRNSPEGLPATWASRTSERAHQHSRRWEKTNSPPAAACHNLN